MCLIYLLIRSVWNVKLVKGWIRPALMLVLQLLNCCAKVGRLSSYWNMCCPVLFVSEMYFKELVDGFAVYEWNHGFGVAVDLRAGALVLIMVRASRLWHMIWSRHFVCCGVLLGLKNGWGCSGFSCDVRGEAQKARGRRRCPLTLEDCIYINTPWKRNRSKIENGLHLDEKDMKL